MLLVEYELSDGFVFLNERMVCPIVKDTGEGNEELQELPFAE